MPWWGVSLVAAGTLATLLTAGAAALTLFVARTIVTPPKRREENIRILAVRPDDGTIVLSSTVDSRLPGDYGLWFAGDAGYARVGEILAATPTAVTRTLIDVSFGDLEAATRARLSGWYYLHPSELGVPTEEVAVQTELGPAPAWRVPPAEPRADGRMPWVIQVHGRAVRRTETIRATPIFREAGYTTLMVSYRNDGEAPFSLDRRYGLGDTEWRDIDAAMAYAKEHGATDLVLMGWSMGGATVLQALTRSEHAELVRGIALDSPVIDWVTALRYQGTLNRLPTPISSAVLALIGKPWGRRLTGQGRAIDLPRLDFVARAPELNLPILLMHSVDDGFVPVTASRALAEERPDIVDFEAFTGAAHCKLWNYDRPRWTMAIRDWLAALPLTGDPRD
ncbi:alpha/beta fold hydrolase [Lacisediminihabitans sp. G11-30]|uniref:Alpha/beta fold hydrolase n=1 Tax=Lacisediminihabitans changchengi TaxID=2787634 RepID=A0A934W2E7_9MICO|nr:alpha/beta fold hydrolase [Lacisediminihabitans changchengi]MBK4348136.1 alpha/beta fold hydrolase [Lacisediminihabitans changchengi]